MIDDRTLAAIARIRSNPDFEIFVEGFLKKELESHLEGCISADLPARFQGAAQAIRQVLNIIHKSEEIYRNSLNREVPVFRDP